MKLFLQYLAVLVAGGALMLLGAWIQSRIDRKTGWHPERDTDIGPPEPPGGITADRWGAEFEALGIEPRKPFLCLAQHPDGWICGRTKGHIDNHIGGSMTWGQK